MWTLKYDTDEHILKQTDSQTQRTDLSPRQRGCEGRKDWEFGIISCKRVYRMNKQQKSYCIAQGTTLGIL